MFTAQDRLNIFENFRVDRQLLKFVQPKRKPSRSQSKGDSDIDGDSEVGTEEMFSFNNGTITIRSESPIVSVSRTIPKSRRERFWAWVRRKKPPTVEMSVTEFFRSMKNTTAQLAIVDERAAGYEKAMTDAVRMGQTALKEQLQKGLLATRSEAQLVAMGLGKYIEEASVVAFAKKSSKSIRLDWIANFVRLIPENIRELKRSADALGIFDNYVVMHHDPTGKSWAETEAERKTRESDPVLFGVIEGRRRLYYVGDWDDEFCDLTLDEVADSLGRDSVKTV
jgi:hypothetical protein